jgi:hypothetical protein
VANFEINSKLNYLTKCNDNIPFVVDVLFLGTGGAFDLAEKNSSVLLKTARGGILIDCGSTVFSELQSKKLLDDINYVFITHTHEDHIGSLSTLIYYKYFVQKQKIKIECLPSVAKKVNDYLINICKNPPESFLLNSNQGIIFSDLSFRAYKIDTTGLHYKDFPSSGFVFNFKKSGNDFFIIYSGDLNCSIIDVIQKSDIGLYNILLEHRYDTFIFHEACERHYPPHFPHCHFLKLELLYNLFPNLFLYHHSKIECKNMLEIIKEKYKNIKDIIIAVDKELTEKLLITEKKETRELLKKQAKYITKHLVALSDNTISVKSVEDFNNEFFVKQM